MFLPSKIEDARTTVALSAVLIVGSLSASLSLSLFLPSKVEDARTIVASSTVPIVGFDESFSSSPTLAKSALVDKVRIAREVVLSNNEPTSDFGFSHGVAENDVGLLLILFVAPSSVVSASPLDIGNFDLAHLTLFS
mmetsp:Transcript_14414/g.31335  ORF Transcript_14414/g.31335 Transcript_14414/m.31335 type:complete len:137 (-) Transcript_14414:265-675(-)